MDILADSPLIPASFFLGFYVFDPPAAQGRSLFPIAIPVSVLVLWLCCAWLSFYLACPCPNRASGKGEAYFTVAFFLSLFLAFGSCPASLSVVHGTWWPRVSCCGRSLLVHSSVVALLPSWHLLLFVLVCCLDAFPLPHEDCTAFFCFALLCTSLMLFGGLIRSRGG